MDDFKLFHKGLSQGTLTEGEGLNMVDFLIKVAYFIKK
jgi:hypothetical protein